MMIQIKEAAICDKNEQMQDGKNNAELQWTKTAWKALEKTNRRD